MPSTLVAGNVFGFAQGFFEEGAGSLTPPSIAGIPCTYLVTGITAGRVSSDFPGNQIAALSGKPLLVDGVSHPIASGPTLNASGNTEVEWTRATNFVVGDSYSVDLDGGDPPPAYEGPTFKAVGALASGTGNITPALPTFSVGDRLLLFVESANQAVTAPSGWTEVSNSPQGTGTAGGTAATRLSVFTKVAVSGESAPTVTDPGDHAAAYIASFDPADIHVTSGDVAATASTTATFPALTTTSDNALIIAAVATATDVGTPRASAWTNGFTERGDAATTQGNGGGIAFATKEQATAGSVGSTQATLATSSVQGRMMIALVTAAGGPDPITGSASGTIDLAGSASGSPQITGSGSGSVALIGASDGTVEATGSASGEITLTGSATASSVEAVTGDAAGTIGLTGAAEASSAVSGDASGSLALTGASAGTVSLSGDASGTIEIAGSAAGSPSITADSTGTIDLSGSADGVSSVTGDATGTLEITGSATEGVSEAIANASGTIALTGAASGSPIISGAAQGDISLTGQAAASAAATGTANGSIDLDGSAQAGTEVIGSASGNIEFEGEAAASTVILAVIEGGLSLTGEARGVVGERPPASTGRTRGSIAPDRNKSGPESYRTHESSPVNRNHVSRVRSRAA